MTDEAVQVKEKFFVAGLITSGEFQKCRFLVVKLHNSFPGHYERPEIRPMLNVEWEEFLTKLKRRYGDGMWGITRSVVVFNNDEFLGDDKTLVNYVLKKYQFSFSFDWYEVGKCHLIDTFQNIMDKFRNLTYMTIAINGRVVGSLLFELYSDVVPLACENFLNKCKDPVAGYSGTPVHRIVKNSWIQCGGWNIPEKPMRCENYVVPHDRRGILCTTNDGRHKNNTSQFFITLAPTPWMDGRYVAFGQLLQGEEVLKHIEAVPTYYEAPKYPITIELSGEVTLDRIPDYLTSNQREEFKALLPSIFLDSLLGPRSDYDKVPEPMSKFDLTRYKKGMYGLRTDMKSYLPFAHLPDYLMPHGGSENGSDTTADDFPDIASVVKSYVYPRIRNFFRSFTLPNLSDTTV